VLLSTFKGRAATTARHRLEDGSARLDVSSSAVVSASLSRKLTAVFDSLTDLDEPVRLFFGRRSPLLQSLRSSSEIRRGFDTDENGKEIAVPAPATELYNTESPLLQDFRAAVERRHGFAPDENGEEVSVPAPVTETHSKDSPVSKSFQGPLDVSVGIDAEGNPTEAPVTARLGEKADVDFSSDSGLTIHFEKAVLFETAEGFSLKLGGSLSIETDGDMKVKAGGKIDIESAGLTVNKVLEVK
jgi:hypothetical protein